MTLLKQIQKEITLLPLEKQTEALDFIIFLQQRSAVTTQTESLTANNLVAQPTDHPYIERVSKILSGEPIIKNTRTPVRAIVEHYQELGNTPEEIVEILPYLRLAQVFDALSYYHDHREEIDKYIEMNRIPVND